MGQTRMVLVVDDSLVPFIKSDKGVTVVASDPLPEAVKQRFIVDVENKDVLKRTISNESVRLTLERQWLSSPLTFTVTEVDVTS